MGHIKVGNASEEVKDGAAIDSACEKMGIPFSCHDGVCGSCMVEVVSGEDNLSELNAAEKEFGLTDKKTRLCCQAKLKSGDVELQSGY